MRLHRLEELEDDVFVPRSGSTNVESPFFVYQSSSDVFLLAQAKSNRMFRREPCPTISLSPRMGKMCTVLLASRTPRLISGNWHPITIWLPPRNSEDAQSRALYCARVVFGVEPKQWLIGDSEARMLAADYFFHQGDKDAFAQAVRITGGVLHRVRGPKLTRMSQPLLVPMARS